jgi:hypothetical protein
MSEEPSIPPSNEGSPRPRAAQIEPPPGAPPDGRPAATSGPAPAAPRGSPLLEYVRANRAAFTEDALRRAALAAGNSLVDVESALAATREPDPPADRGRAVRNVFLWYLGVFALLAVLMLINPANSRSDSFGDVRGLGIMLLAMSLGACFVGSLVWIASRRIFWAIVGAGIAFVGIDMIATTLSSPYGPGFPVSLAILGIGVAVIVAALKVARTAMPARPSMTLLMLLPMLALLVIGGTCVATGLPIPRPA